MADGHLGARAEGYLRTAREAAKNHDWPQAFENARTACELAAKAILERKGIAFGKEHNVTSQLVQANLLPGGDVGRRFSKFMGDATRGVYGFNEPVRRDDAEKGIRMAEEMLRRLHELA